MSPTATIEINLDSVEDGLRLCLDARRQDSLYDAEQSALANNEARFQLVEGCYYDYTFTNSNYTFADVGEQIVLPHSRNKHTGTLSTNIFVGTLSLPVLFQGEEKPRTTIELEVQSVKTGYREDYQQMLEYITEKCTDLLLLANSPVSQNLEIDYTKDSQTLYQKFAFVKSVVGTDEFAESINRIVNAPVTRWAETTELRDIRQARRFSGSQIKDILKGSNRTKLPESHWLTKQGLDSLPEKIPSTRKTDSVDTPENRFVKHSLETILKFCTDINTIAVSGSTLFTESSALIGALESYLHHTIFKHISRPTTLKLNSPVLQRKEGYREILRVWLMFDLAAKLIWTGGNDVYRGGKKDVATLYEYWLFFKLLDLFQSIFRIEQKDISDLIQKTPDGLNLRIKQGRFTALKGVYDSGLRRLNVRFCYNRSFQGKSEENSYPKSGSWTTTLRPDYTLSFWPEGITEDEAEEQELIVHVHFDAKYKVANFDDLLSQKSYSELDEEEAINRKGIYKNIDLLKMHAYKDAIRRTGGAYVLYPGDKETTRRGFHEVLPGLGAFPVCPSKQDGGMDALSAFIHEVIKHFLNRATQREKLAFRTYDIFQLPPESGNELREPLPEPYGVNRSLLPDYTPVVVGYYKAPLHYDWIKKTGFYNFRTGTGTGSITMDREFVSARYLLLHTTGDSDSGDLWRIVSKGPKVYSKQDLTKLNYPNAGQDFYLVIEIEPVTELELLGIKWDFKKLKNYSGGRLSAAPFTCSLNELMRNKIKETVKADQ